MLKYILKRLGYSILVLLGVSLVIYFLTRLMPIDFVRDKVNSIQTSGATVSAEMVDAMYKSYGLSADASFMDILEGYFNWLGDLVRFDLGTSFKFGTPVADVIASKMGTSFAIALIATVFEFMIAIPLGITAATHQYTLRDYIVTILVMVGISLPAFFFGNILRGIFGDGGLGWFPSLGLQTAGASLSGIDLLLDYARHVFLPVLTVVILSIGARMRMTRTNMLEVLNSDYIRTARAKGLKEKKVINKHAFRNTMIPLVTSLAGLLPSLFSGAIITEQVFDLPGIGNVALQAMNAGDIPFIMGYNMFLALLSVLGVLLADLMYGLVDPRVKLE